MPESAASTEEFRKQLAVTRWLRRVACLLALAPVVLTIGLVALNRLTNGGMHFLVSGAPWTHTFWTALLCAFAAGGFLLLLTVGRRCPRCGNGFFVNKTFRASTTRNTRGSVNVFAQRCINCRLPLS